MRAAAVPAPPLASGVLSGLWISQLHMMGKAQCSSAKGKAVPSWRKLR
nr:MAG TPA: hypothetical protein [Caudoviricetes sp.]